MNVFYKPVKLGFILTLLLQSSMNTYANDLDNQSLAEAYKASYQYEKVQNYTDAIRTLLVINDHYPSGYTVNLRLGHLYHQQGKYSNALSHYQTAHQKKPSAISPLLGKMTVGLAQQEYAEVEKIGFTILKRDYYNYFANLKLSQALLKLNKFELAQKTISKILSFYPEDVTFLGLLAYNYLLQNKTTEADQVYNTVLILDPENIYAKRYFATANHKK